eukprot:9275855-Ditylum_brightwellii.AAC.1
MDNVTYFLGITFAWKQRNDDNLEVYLNQPAFTAEHFVQQSVLATKSLNSKSMPCCSGYLIDSIPHQGIAPQDRATLHTQM